MSGNRPVVAPSYDVASGSRVRYVVGFISSIILTLIAFELVHIHVAHHHTYPSDGFMMISLAVLAVIQLFVQLVCFLHIGRESKPRWNAIALSFAAIVVLILVIGSLWIMSNLNYRMMQSPTQIQHYLDTQGDL